MRQNGNYSGQRPNRMLVSRTLFVAAVCGIFTFVLLGVQLFKVMIIQHNEYEELAVSNQTKETSVSATRGTIYDTNGNVLAISASAENIFLSPYEINKYNENVDLIADFLSELLEIDRQSIIEKTKDTKYWYKTVAMAQPSEITDKVREFKKENNIVGVHLETTSKRYYPNEDLACHVIGFTGTDGNGLEGVEYLYDKYLQGTNGSIIRLRDGNGSNMMFSKYEYYYDAQDGAEITTTIDSTIQYIVEKYLDQAIADYKIQNGGCAILMNINTGELYAIASRGSFDLNNYLDISQEKQAEIAKIQDEKERAQALADAQREQWRNTAISNTYEPGSVFKIITMAMALEEGVVNENTSLPCSGSIQVKGDTEARHCWRRTGHGPQNLVEAAQHSCNVAFINIGLRVGADLFYKYIEAFGLRDKTGVDLTGESDSIWWSDEVFCDENNLSQLAAASFGQTFNVTPIQVITAVAAACNGGYLLEPYVVKSITNSEGEVLYEKNRTVVRKVISEETSEKVCSILEQVVGGKGGTGSNAYVSGYRVGGKTGTTTKTTVQAQEGRNEYMVSFCAVAPTDDPEVVCLLVLDNPSRDSGIYISGGQMAAPAVGQILSEVLPYLGVEPVYSEEELQFVNVAVDYVKSMTVADAKAALEKSGLSVKVVGDGDTVIEQIPAANARVTKGTEVILYTSGERPTNNVKVPSLYGMTVSEAKAALSSRGLYLEIGGVLPTSSSIVVQSQSTPAGTEVKYGSVVSVTLVDKSKVGQY